MRTEQFLRGYDSCRSNLQHILIKNLELQKNKELMEIAQYPYYKDDGKNWHPDCSYCDHRVLNIDLEYNCIKNVKIEDIKDHCLEKM